jgi:PAS domain-containing protein
MKKDSFLYWALMPTLIAVGLVIAGILAFYPGAIKWFNNEKAWELTLQFLFVAVLGGGVALFYRSMETLRSERLRDEERLRELMEAQRAALEKLRQELVENYHSTKKVRRTFRAITLPIEGTEHHGCGREGFAKLMEQLEEIQLRAEALAAEVEAHEELFSREDKNKLELLIKTPADYLRDLLRYYEEDKSRPAFGENHNMITLNDALTIFAGINGEETINRNYYYPISEARRLIVALIEQKIPQPLSASRMKVLAVGTPIAERPPHRSERAQFGHSAPTSGV